MQTITIILEKDDKIEEIRKQYIPEYEKTEPHITLVYSFETKKQEKLFQHITESIKEFKPFEITLSGLKKSQKEFYLYLLVDKGNEIIMKLHEKLNGGMLNDFRNPLVPKYVPHITLGIFETKEELKNANNEIYKMNLNFKMKIKTIQLLTINKENEIIDKKEFAI